MSDTRVASRQTGAAHTVDAADVIRRLIRLAVWVVCAIIALAIVFKLLGANVTNGFVSRIHIWAHTLAGPFAGMFTLHSPKWTLALNYAIAIVVYLILAELIIGLIAAMIVPARRRAGSVSYDT